MWWEPRTREEELLAEILPRMEGLFLENRRRGTVFGVGSFLPGQFYNWGRDSGLLDYWRHIPLWRRMALALFPSRLPLTFFRQLESRWWHYARYYWQYHWFGWHGERLPSHGSYPLVLLNQDLADQSIIPMAPYLRFDLPAAARAEVGQWNLPDDTVFLFVSPPEAVGAEAPAVKQNNRAIRCATTGSLGTAGVRLTGNNAPAGASGAFLTVGHMFPNGCNSLVEVVKHRWPRWLRSPHYQQVGRVVSHSTPQGANGPAYDAAVVEMDVESPFPDLAHTGVALTPPHYEQPVLGTVYGGVSGVVRDAGIVGAMRAHGSPEMLWKNSWLLVPAGAIVRGDSGGAFVLDGENKVAGMVVGGSRVGTSSRFMVQYVQDMASIQKDFLRPAGFSIA
jgi:hypothetical protein